MNNLKVTTARGPGDSISASLDTMPDGHIQASDAQTLDTSLWALLEVVGDTVQARLGVTVPHAIRELEMQGRWIHGRYHVRWLALPGFEVDFSTEEALSDFLVELALAAVPGLEDMRGK